LLAGFSYLYKCYIWFLFIIVEQLEIQDDVFVEDEEKDDPTVVDENSVVGADFYEPAVANQVHQNNHPQLQAYDGTFYANYCAGIWGNSSSSVCEQSGEMVFIFKK